MENIYRITWKTSTKLHGKHLQKYMENIKELHGKHLKNYAPVNILPVRGGRRADPGEFDILKYLESKSPP